MSTSGGAVGVVPLPVGIGAGGTGQTSAAASLAALGGIGQADVPIFGAALLVNGVHRRIATTALAVTAIDALAPPYGAVCLACGPVSVAAGAPIVNNVAGFFQDFDAPALTDLVLDLFVTDDSGANTAHVSATAAQFAAGPVPADTVAIPFTGATAPVFGGTDLSVAAGGIKTTAGGLFTVTGTFLLELD